MTKIWLSITSTLLLMTAFLFPGCTQAGSALNGSGKIIDHDIDIADFDSLQIQGLFNLEISQAASFKVTLSTDDNLISRIQFSRNDKTLKTKIEAPATFFPTSLKLKVAMPNILNLNITGGTKATISGFQSLPNFNLVSVGASSLNGKLEADSTNFYLSGGSQVSLQGQAKTLDIDADGASKISLGDFVTSSADVKLGGASSAIVNVSGELDVILKDASKIYYFGNPLIRNTSITGDSSMIHQ
jgi:hypothetical protein